MFIQRERERERERDRERERERGGEGREGGGEVYMRVCNVRFVSCLSADAPL